MVNLLAVWRAHGLAEVMRECWDSGVVLAGWSAGSLCWHRGGVTDSFSDALDPFSDGLGFLPYSNGVHDDFDGQPRRHGYRRLVAEGALPAGYASEDGVGLHYVGTDLREAVTIAPGKHAWWVEPAARGGFRQQPIDPRPI
ncbi:MAG: Type 1 glutamine amidotransferase-like domain-containing protein [Streptosporangiaceae bacterium]